MSKNEGPSEKDFEQLVELNNTFDQQLADLGRESAESGSSSSSQKTFSWKKILLVPLLLAAGLIIPFVVLVRTSVIVYLDYGFNGWLALVTGIVATVVLLLTYGLFVSYWFNKRLGIHRYFVRAVLVLVTAYSMYGLLYYSGLNTKTDEINSYYRSLHPIMRVALTTITLADSDIVVTDIQRRPEDYAQMGLPKNEHSLHYRQSNGYVHAVDLRTRGRAEWKNGLTRLAFWSVGLHNIRHNGTADHLHIYLPLNE